MRRTGARLLASALAGCLLAGCATKPPPQARTRVILLPQADGTASAVTVQALRAPADTTALRLDQPYQAALAQGPTATPQAPLEPEAVRNRYGSLFSMAPPAPARFLLYFRTGTTQLTPESQQAVQQVMAETLARSGAEIVLIGHTDTTSTGESNDALSLRRALLVREQFIRRGVPSALIEATGRGERDLAVKTRDGVDEPRNRRVEILVR